MTETLATSMEAWWTDFINHKGRVTMSKATTTGTVDKSFIVQLAVNDIDEVLKAFYLLQKTKNAMKLPRKLSKLLK